MKKEQFVLLSPFLIIAVNFCTAFLFGQVIGKWAFVPMIMIGWMLWLYFILKFGKGESIKKWFAKPIGKIGWAFLAIAIGLIPLPLFIFHYHTLSNWHIWVPWITLALINPWIEEFYWRGLLLDFTKNGRIGLLFYTAVFYSL